jgi:hypothetical protein
MWWKHKDDPFVPRMITLWEEEPEPIVGPSIDTSLTDPEIVRGGIDSLAWLVNNAHNHDSPYWQNLEAAAAADRNAALEALARMTREMSIPPLPQRVDVDTDDE